MREDEGNQQELEQRQFQEECDGEPTVDVCSICGDYQRGLTYSAEAFRIVYGEQAEEILSIVVGNNAVCMDATLEDSDQIHVCANCGQDGW